MSITENVEKTANFFFKENCMAYFYVAKTLYAKINDTVRNCTSVVKISWIKQCEKQNYSCIFPKDK